MKSKDIEPYAYEVIYPDGDGQLFYMQHFAKERAVEVEGEVRGLHTAEQMQEYAKAQAKNVFWYAAKGTSEDRALLARAIDYAFKEKQNEEV